GAPSPAPDTPSPPSPPGPAWAPVADKGPSASSARRALPAAYRSTPRSGHSSLPRIWTLLGDRNSRLRRAMDQRAATGSCGAHGSVLAVEETDGGHDQDRRGNHHPDRNLRQA